MPFTWPFNPRPYADDVAAEVLADVVDPKTADWHYNKHHKGYVDALNNIEKGLSEANKETANGNYSVYGELKRRFGFNHAGVMLHDLYWQNLGGDGDIQKAPSLAKALEAEFGSHEDWQKDMVATAMSTKTSGWAVLTFDRLYSGRLINVLVDEHQNGAMWGGVPLIALDMFEHAYYHHYGPGRPPYIDAFFKNLDWGRIEQQYKKFCS